MTNDNYPNRQNQTHHPPFPPHLFPNFFIDRNALLTLPYVGLTRISVFSMKNVVHNLPVSGLKGRYILLRLAMTFIAVFCGSAGYGAVTPAQDDDIVVTVAHATAQENLQTIANHAAFPQSTVQLPSCFAPASARTPSASSFSSSLGVCFTGLCRSNR